jgi:hypothetical protein
MNTLTDVSFVAVRAMKAMGGGEVESVVPPDPVTPA